MPTISRRILTAAALASLIAAAHPAHAIDFNPLSYVKGAVEAVVEDRSAGDIAKDAEIKAKIIATITDQMGSDVISFNTDVYEQDVMITGVVETGDLKAKAGQIVKTIEGVKRLYNEVLVIPKVKQDKGVVEGFVDDTVIETKINAQLIDAKAVNVTNFRWRSIGGHVFLFGRAFTKDELDKAVKVVKGIENVTKVTSRVKIKPKS
ncbi:BON domain-containing protein [Magnetovibrio sp.]|uniref:BON domain-containing protein n=1 Tax=Magnetovibrio sp. TaxID=2024836 RepID=UPI002F92361E